LILPRSINRSIDNRSIDIAIPVDELRSID